jgi:hypothetical protein
MLCLESDADQARRRNEPSKDNLAWNDLATHPVETIAWVIRLDGLVKKHWVDTASVEIHNAWSSRCSRPHWCR